MSARKQKILLIEKYPIMEAFYKETLQQYGDTPFQIKTVLSITEAQELLKNNAKYDIVIVSNDYAIQDEGVSEERFLATLKAINNTCKLMLLSTKSNEFKVQRIIKMFQPNVFLWKQEVDKELLAKSIEALWGNTSFYSPMISAQNNKIIASNIVIDTTDVDLLFHLAKNSKTKDLPNKLNLSLGAIEKRKNKLKQKLNTKNLLQIAYENGVL